VRGASPELRRTLAESNVFEAFGRANGLGATGRSSRGSRR